MDNDVARRTCSFCGTPGQSGTPFAGGLGAMICQDCVERFHRMFNDPADLEAETEPPWNRMSDAEMLAALPMIAETAEQVDEFLVEWVELCRSRKLSWAAIGQVFGTSRQSAWERFARRVDKVSDRRRRSSSA